MPVIQSIFFAIQLGVTKLLETTELNGLVVDY